MEAKKIYQQLDTFITPELTDSWKTMTGDIDIQSYVTDNFKERFMWLVTDNTQNIDKVFTAVFLNEKIVKNIIEKDIVDALIFTHHPMHWDINTTPVFANLPATLFEELKKRRISSYNLHVPLDKNWPYSTSYNLAEKLWIQQTWEFANYFWTNVGIIGKTEHPDIHSLAKNFEEIVWHEVKIYPYGDFKILHQIVGVIGGGGFDQAFLQELKEIWINTLITWITADNEYSKTNHDFAKENKINIIWWTHYSTEKFACQRMVEYFKEMWLESEFIEDIPCKEDM